MRSRWQDSKWLNWRITPHLCIRLMPGCWYPDIWHNREKKYFAVCLPGLGIMLDYEETQ